MDYLIVRNCDVLRLENGRPVVDAGQDILIRGQRIEAVRPTGQTPEAGDAEVIDASGLLAMPGQIGRAHV